MLGHWYTLLLAPSGAAPVYTLTPDDIAAIAAAVLAAMRSELAVELAMLRNKQITNPSTGKMTVYDDDGVTVLAEGDLFEDAAGTQPYRGQGAERRERLA